MDTKKKAIFQVEKPKQKPILICKTECIHWMIHESGGIFILDIRTGGLFYFKKTNPFTEFREFLFNKNSNWVSKNGNCVFHNAPRLFFPFKDGFFYRKEGQIYYRDIKSSKNIYCCLEPADKSWNAFNGQIIYENKTGLTFETINRSMDFEIDFHILDFKGTKNGIYVRDFNCNVFYYPKPDWMKSSNSLTEF